jgi:hypothetical protein
LDWRRCSVIVCPIVDFKMSNTLLGAMHMPAGAIAVLLALLLVVNPLLRVLSSKLAFTRGETIVVYITCLFSTLVPGRGAENFFVPNILSSFYFATRENKWLDFLTPYLKPWMTPAINANGQVDPLVAQGWYEGGVAVPWAQWMTPLVAWSALILAVHIMHACLGVMLRAQWAEREALSFPLLRLPLELTDESRGHNAFFKNPLVWVGVGIAVFIEGLNGLNLYFPEVPNVPLGLNTGMFFTEAPWNQLGPTQANIYLVIIAVSFLLTSEVSFSLWFFTCFRSFSLWSRICSGFSPPCSTRRSGRVAGPKALPATSKSERLSLMSRCFAGRGANTGNTLRAAPWAANAPENPNAAKRFHTQSRSGDFSRRSPLLWAGRFCRACALKSRC